MRWEQTEFLLKGIYLGLLLLVGLQGPTWAQIAVVGACMLGALALCLGVAAYRKLREGYRVRGRLAGFVLFLILENPGLVYTGLLVGLTLGAYTQLKERDDWQMIVPVAGGAALGLVFWYLRHVRRRDVRRWLSLALAMLLVGGAIAFLNFHPEAPTEQIKQTIGYLLLLGIPGFYLLTFASVVEESEIEIGAICAALGVALWIFGEQSSPYTGSAALFIPLAVYFVYTRRVLPGLKVFKHTLRGISYARVGRYRWALVSLGRALQLDPDNRLARDHLWALHQEMDLDQLLADPETLAVVNYELCLERVAWLLLLDRPKAEHAQEAHKLLDLVESQRPELKPRCRYWRAVAFTHQREFEGAAAALESVLAAPAEDSPQRRAVLLSAWQLALLLHPEMKRRVGEPLVKQPDRRLEAIAACERQITFKADDPAAWNLKRLLYSELTEDIYHAATEGKAVNDFDYGYCEQLGLALIDKANDWQRGAEYLRLAAVGQPARAPALYLEIAQAHQKAGDGAGYWANVERAKQIGRAVGPASLAEADRTALFAAVKQLADHAREQGDVDRALDSLKFYTLNDRAGVETYRALAELFEQRAGTRTSPKEKEDDIWWALNCTEHALSYNAKEPDLLARKDKYYYSVSPEEVKARWDQVRLWFDVDYCLNKARWVLDQKNVDLDLLDWANHLADLAQAAKPDSLSAKVVRARVKRLRGEISEALALLEEVRTGRPEKFPSGEEEEAWFVANRLLGEMYLDENPAQAVECLRVYQKHPKSGATTLFNLGRAYENLGDYPRAAKCYEQVTAYEGNPLVYEAQDALYRVKQQAGSGSGAG